MGYALFSQATNWIANAYGDTCPTRLAEAVNAIRRTLYSWYAELEVVPTIEEAFEIQRFPQPGNDCAEWYHGITLPRGFGTPEAMWYNNLPVQLFDRWRQWHTGITPPCECGLKSDVVGLDFPTERDLWIGEEKKLSLLPANPADAGKVVVIRGKTLGGAPFEQALTLAAGPVRTDLPLCSIDRPGGVVKDVTLGAVILAVDGGRTLSVFAADERVPAYTRLKITGLREHVHHVNVRANRRYFPISDPYDSVEHDNQMAWEAMARSLRINRKTTRGQDEIQSEMSYAAQAKSLLMGDKAREIGKSTQSQVEVRSPLWLRTSKLVGRRRRF